MVVTGQGIHRTGRVSLEAFERVDDAGEFTESSQIPSALWIRSSDIPQFTQIDNYDSLIAEIKFPVLFGSSPKEGARNRLDPG